ncbi:hypothetical protein LX32DRAFT_708949 [Colletotrichum zoysiae]|uniref:Uncharacterized protein n=1 Tax=Colletotrichum zoysiae TaxID=1216348 RepID=A0AAD9H814_9PEZI|nr:hypothetical protein LX32DRAFT_708949 [Colletotrichum zoysiae]
MVNYYIFALAGLAAQVSALPLNINLGAYSPALVVGDGEISFGGKSDVSQLMNVLEGAAVNAAQGAGQAAGGGQGAGGQGAGRAAAPATEAPATAAAVPQSQPQEIQQNQQAPSIADVSGGAAPVTATSSDNQVNEAQAIAALQGMGKEIAPRVQLSKSHAAGEKRDLAGFDRALKYAEVALTKGPKIDLGTGEGGSGVGIKVDNNQGGAAQAGAGGQRAAGRVKARADEAQQPRRRAKVTTIMRPGVEMTSDKLVARDPAAPVAQVVPATSNNVVKRAQEELAARGVSGGAIDTVNLNVSGEGVTMTFVETEADEVDEQQ